jgi:hypothetical protein
MPDVSAPLEPTVYRIGEQLARLSAGRIPMLFEGRWWSQTALNMAMRDSRFKAQLFRFIDVLPSITDGEQVLTLAREYLGDGNAPSSAPNGDSKPFPPQAWGPGSAVTRSEPRWSIWRTPLLQEQPSRKRRHD